MGAAVVFWERVHTPPPWYVLSLIHNPLYATRRAMAAGFLRDSFLSQTTPGQPRAR